MTRAELEAIEARANRAAPGPCTDVPALVAEVRRLGGDLVENAGGCSIRGCLAPMLADTENWPKPLCGPHFFEFEILFFKEAK